MNTASGYGQGTVALLVVSLREGNEISSRSEVQRWVLVSLWI